MTAIKILSDTLVSIATCNHSVVNVSFLFTCLAWRKIILTLQQNVLMYFVFIRLFMGCYYHLTPDPTDIRPIFKKTCRGSPDVNCYQKVNISLNRTNIQVRYTAMGLRWCSQLEAKYTQQDINLTILPFLRLCITQQTSNV